MPNTNKSLRTVSSNFVIPVGTQVVIQTKLETSSGGFRKMGAVAFVVRSPPSNAELYEIQFSDGSVAQTNFENLVLRRREIDMLLADNEFDYRPYVIYRCRVGSRAFGLSHEDSDDDLRGIFLPPANVHWSLKQLPEQVESIENGVDEVYWEVEKFVRLALKANPNILETLWTPDVLHSTPVAERLREMRQSFLSKHVYKTYSGYVLSQFRKMKNRIEQKGRFKPKHAMHLIRLLYSGIHAVKHGEILVDVSAHRDELLSIRNEDIRFEEVVRLAYRLDEEFQSAFEKTRLPAQPDLEAIDAFLIDARRSRVE